MQMYHPFGPVSHGQISITLKNEETGHEEELPVG